MNAASLCADRDLTVCVCARARTCALHSVDAAATAESVRSK